MKTIRIGAAQGFYGDTIDAAVYTAKYGDVQYICFDCLAELTMAILAKDKNKDERLGYTKDLTVAMKSLLPYVKEKGIKLLTNAGGINPLAAKDEVVRVARELGITDLKVAVVTGDDVLPNLKNWQEQGVDLSHADTNKPFDATRDYLFANAYLGVWPIVEALKQGAEVIITGRTTDSAQFLAPAVYEFGWQVDDWNQLAHGILMGHLLECSAQSTGGNFSGDWHSIGDMDTIGYPIAEIGESGEFMITKAEGSGGLVSFDTVREQLLYEIHDPSSYITPDVIVDLSQVCLEEIGEHQVRVSNVFGKPAPRQLKVVMGYGDGYMSQTLIGYSWPKAYEKAQRAAQIIEKQIRAKKVPIDELHFDYVGYNSLHGPLASEPTDDINEIYLRIAVKAQSKEIVATIPRFIPPLGLNGPPSLGGLMNLPPRQLLGMWATLIDRMLIEPAITITYETIVQEVV
ncbi:acyclic terpene utilization AtuA family protein [Lysinibacillus sp. LZ02]|uniref:acyclic terpene utilization AtuA family protein n=1 Tax=Lysinibacillus sp. LZ02 TaxID=3420668 RepID=UPI003D36C858